MTPRNYCPSWLLQAPVHLPHAPVRSQEEISNPNGSAELSCKSAVLCLVQDIMWLHAQQLEQYSLHTSPGYLGG